MLNKYKIYKYVYCILLESLRKKAKYGTLFLSLKLLLTTLIKVGLPLWLLPEMT